MNEAKYQAWKKNRERMHEFHANLMKIIAESYRCDRCIAKSQQRVCSCCGEKS